MLLDALDSRREAAEYLNKRFGLNIHVYYNKDVESANYNFMRDLEDMASTGLLKGKEAI